MIQTAGGDRTVTVTLKAATSNYIHGVRSSAAETARLSGAQNAAHATTGKLGGGMSALTKTLIGGAGLKVAFDATAGAAIAWESAFAGVLKTVDGTPEQLAAISEGLRGMSKEIPTSAEDLAAIAESAGQLGIETPSVLGFTKVIADLGETTNLAGQEGATQLARLANITQMAQGDFERLGSTVVALGNSLATTEAEIVAMGLRIAGAGEQVGMTEGEILAVAGALSSVGIEAEAGGSAISKVMIEIASEVENGGDKLDTFARVAGMSAAQFSQAWRDDAATALNTFIAGLGNMEDQGQSTLQVLEELDITEVRMRDALLRSSGASDVLTSALELQERAWSENTALQEEAEKRYETTAAKIDMAKNSLREMGREAGEDVLPVLAKLAEGFVALSESVDVGSPQAALEGWESSGERTDDTLTRLKLTAEGLRQGASDLARDIPLVGEALADWSDRNSLVARGLESYLNPALQHFTEEWRQYVDVAPEAGQQTDELAEFMAHLGGSIELTEDQLNDLSKTLDGFIDPLGTYQDMIRAAAETTADSTKTSKDSWRDYADSVDVSLEEFTASLQQQVSDLHAWEDNLVTIAQRTSAGFALTLAEMGPEAAGLVAQMADATDDELAELERLFGERGDVSGADYVNGLVGRLEDAAGTVKAHAQFLADAANVATEFARSGALAGQGWIQGLESMNDRAVLASSEFGRQVSGALRFELQEQSPSKVWERSGIQSVAGYIRGIEGEASRLDGAMRRLFASTRDPSSFEGAGSDALQAELERIQAIRDAADRAAQATDDLARRRDLLRAGDTEAVARHDADAARAAADRALAEQQAALEAELRAAQERERAEERMAANRAEFEFGFLNVDQQLRLLDRRLAGEEMFTDEWMSLVDQRQRILDQEAQAARRAADEQQRVFDDQLTGLNRMLDEQERIQQRQRESQLRHLEQIAAERDRYRQAVAGETDRFGTARGDAIAGRRAELIGQVGIDADGFQAGVLVNTIRQQIGSLEEWTAGLAQLRARGVSEDVIEALGLGEGPEALGRVRSLLAGTDAELEQLNLAIADRAAMIDARVAAEQTDRATALGAHLARLHTDHLDRLAALESEHLSRMSDLEADWTAEQEQFAADLAAIGADQGRSWTDAIAEGIASGLPAIEEQVRRVQQAMRDLKEAEAAAGAAEDRSTTNTVAQTAAQMRANLGLPPDPVSDLAWAAGVAAGTHDLANLERRLRQKATSFDSGGRLPPGLTVAYNGTGRDEHVVTGPQMASMGGMPSTVTVVMEVDSEVVGRITAPVVGNEVRVKTGWKRS